MAEDMATYDTLPKHLVIRDIFLFSLQKYCRLDQTIKRRESGEYSIHWNEERGRLILWGVGFSVSKGELDVVFIQCKDKHLRESTILSLINLAKAVAAALAYYEPTCGGWQAEWTEFLKEVVDELPEELDIGSELLVFDDPFDTNVSDIIEDIKGSIDCLYDLAPSIEVLFIHRDISTAADKDYIQAPKQGLKSVPATVEADTRFSAKHYTHIIQKRFPKIEISLAEALGEINWSRHQRIRQTATNQEAPKAPVRKPSVEEWLKGSISNFRAPMSSSQHNSFVDNKSVLSATSFRTTSSTSSAGGNEKVPRPPTKLMPGVKYECNICFKMLTGVDTKLLWEEHVLRDLQPYSCLFTSCAEREKTYSSRRLWVAHEFKYHRPQYTSKWHCGQNCNKLFNKREELEKHILLDHLDGTVTAADLDDIIARCEEKCYLDTIRCPFCKKEIKETESSIQLHIGTHMDEIALKLLPQALEAESNLSDQSITSGGTPTEPIASSAICEVLEHGDGRVIGSYVAEEFKGTKSRLNLNEDSDVKDVPPFTTQSHAAPPAAARKSAGISEDGCNDELSRSSPLVSIGKEACFEPLSEGPEPIQETTTIRHILLAYGQPERTDLSGMLDPAQPGPETKPATPEQPAVGGKGTRANSAIVKDTNTSHITLKAPLFSCSRSSISHSYPICKVVITNDGYRQNSYYTPSSSSGSSQSSGQSSDGYSGSSPHAVQLRESNAWTQHGRFVPPRTYEADLPSLSATQRARLVDASSYLIQRLAELQAPGGRWWVVGSGWHIVAEIIMSVNIKV